MPHNHQCKPKENLITTVTTQSQPKPHHHAKANPNIHAQRRTTQPTANPMP